MENKVKLSDLREKYGTAGQRPKKLRFFWELIRQAQDAAISEEQEQPERFDWDDAAMLTEDFKMQLAERGFPETEVFWSLGYCQGDGVAFYGSVYPEDLKEKDPNAKKFIEALERAGDVLSIWVTGKNNHYHHWNSMTVEVEFEEEDEILPLRLRIARPFLREEFEDYLDDKVQQISRELEKSGYAEIEYHCSNEAIREELLGREHLYEKDGTLALREFEFYEWMKTQNTADAGVLTEQI